MATDPQLKRAISDYLGAPSTVDALVAASEAGRPAIEAIGSDLLDQFGNRVRAHGVKIQIGRLVRPILEAHGFQIYKRRQPARSRLFSKGAVYGRVPRSVPDTLDEHGIHFTREELEGELDHAVAAVVGKPPYVASYARLDVASIASAPPVLADTENRTSVFAMVLANALDRRERCEAASIPAGQLTAAEWDLLSASHSYSSRGPADQNLRSVFKVSALCATALSMSEAAHFLRRDQRTVAALVRGRRLYSMADAWGPRLPLFQLHADNVVPHVEKVLPRLGEDIHPLGVFNWFTTPNPDLASEQTSFEPTSPRDWLVGHQPAAPVVRLAAEVAGGTPS